MERPYNGHCAQQEQENASQRQNVDIRVSGTCNPCDHTEDNDYNSRGCFYDRPPDFDLSKINVG